jgi:parvulin-like peptidyl-prolyl isomerase
MAKRVRKPAEPAEPKRLTKKQIAKSARVRRRERNTIIGLTLVAVLVVGVLIYGAVHEYVVKPNSPIATVDGVPISTRLYQKYWRYMHANTSATLQQYQAELDQLNAKSEKSDTDTILIQYYQQMVQQLKNQLMGLDMAVLDSMIDDELVRQEARKEGITVTPEEVQAEIEKAFGFERNPPTPTPTAVVTETATATETATPAPTPTVMTEAQFQSAYTRQRDYVQQQFGFTEQEFRALFEVQLLRDKLQAVLAERVPTTEEQVHARHILVETEEEAKKVIERLKAGEDFAALAKELSKDDSNKDKGGDLGWFGRGVMVTEFENAAFALEPGKISDLVKTDYGYHIIQVLEKDANHPLDEATLSQRKSNALKDWLSTQRYSDRVKRYWSSDKKPRVAETTS